MQKYIVRIKTPNVRNNLINHFEKVGKPKAIHNTLIIETNKPKQELENIDGVIKVKEDVEIELGETQENPKNWALPKICNESDKYIYNRTGKNVDIYIIDTGIRHDHVEFQDQNKNSRVTDVYAPDGLSYDPEYHTRYHGTVCASQSAGKECGVAKEANLFNSRIYGSTAVSTVKGLDKVLEHHQNKNNNPSVVNMSFGSKSDDFLDDETKDLVENGMICVACAHNYSEEQSTTPARYDWIISVGATTQDNCIAMFSNYGETVDIFAPGRSVYGAKVDSKDHYYDNCSGTSYASPLVAGVLALIVQDSIIKTEEHVNQAKQILFDYINQHTINNINAYDEETNSYNQDLPCWYYEYRPNTTNKFLYSLVENEWINNKPDEDYYITSCSNCATIIYNDDGNKYDTYYGADALQKIEDDHNVKIEEKHYNQDNYLSKTDFIVQKGMATYYTPRGGKHTVYSEGAEETLRKTYDLQESDVATYDLKTIKKKKQQTNNSDQINILVVIFELFKKLFKKV